MNNIFLSDSISFLVILPILFITFGICLIAIKSRCTGTILRVLLIFSLILIILEPSINDQIRNPIEDTVLIITDKSFSQKISNRIQNTEKTEKDLIKKLEILPNTTTKLAYLEEKNDFNKEIHVKVRSTGKLIKAKVELNNDFANVNLYEDEYGISPGQACVFYKKNKDGYKVLGGGWIKK